MKRPENLTGLTPEQLKPHFIAHLQNVKRYIRSLTADHTKSLCYANHVAPCYASIESAEWWFCTEYFTYLIYLEGRRIRGPGYQTGLNYVWKTKYDPKPRIEFIDKILAALA